MCSQCPSFRPLGLKHEHQTIRALFKIAKKKFGDKILAIFRSKKGVWGEPGFVVVVVVRRREAQNPNVPNRQKRPSREKK